MGSITIQSIIESPGDSGSSLGITLIQRLRKEQHYPGVVRQHHYGGLHQLPGRPKSGFDRDSKSNHEILYRTQNNCVSTLSRRLLKQPSRSPIAQQLLVGLDVKPLPISVHRHALWSTHDRPLCVNANGTVRTLQQSLLRSVHNRCGRSFTERLEYAQQFCEPAVSVHQQNPHVSGRGASHSYSNSPMVASAEVVQETVQNGNLSSNSVKEYPSLLRTTGTVHSPARTAPKSKVENIRLADLWKKKLLKRGWTLRASEQFVLCWAASTLQQYDRVIQNYLLFCGERSIHYPDLNTQESVCVEFLCSLADKSDRPQSVLKTALAALGMWFRVHDIESPLASKEASYLFTALVKSSTKRPAKRTAIMPLAPFISMVNSWEMDCSLSLKQLRLKAVLLLTIALMARPSDLAPKAKMFDGVQTTSLVTFSKDRLQFHPDGSLTVVLFGIKNDTDRSGFTVRIPKGSNVKTDPVSTLKTYIERTESVRKGDSAVFLSLNYPYHALKADSIASILQEAIHLVGLDKEGFTPKSFRPSSATASIQNQVDPHTAMQIGRWKSKDVFYDHYVYPCAPSRYTDNVQSFTGISYSCD